MNRRLTTTLLSAVLAVFVGIAAGCGGGSGGGGTATALAAKPGNGGGKTATEPTSGGRTVTGEGRFQLIDGVDSSQLSATGPAESAKAYIVRMADVPTLLAYRGGTAERLPAERNGRYNPESAAAQAHAAKLVRDHDRALAAVGIPSKDKLYSYVHSFNGFAAKMTPGQARKLASRGDVLNVWPDEMRELHTNFSPEFLGLDAPNGPWDTGVDGEGVIVGVIDTGIWPENPSFSDQADLSLPDGKGNRAGNDAYGPPPAHWLGICESGEQWSQDDCNNKLIGVRYFPYGFGVNLNARNGVVPQGYNSARDDDDVGHGSHTSSTAAGNRGVNMQIAGADVLVDSEGSGIAPRARVAHYKACWNTDGCITSDLVAAIDSAVADGVDVINYSIGSSSTFLYGPDDIAFLFAESEGVYVATSNGNSGPGAGTTGSPAGDPWLISVGNATREGITTTLGARVNSPESLAGVYSALEGAITRPLSVTGPVTGDVAAADPLDACAPLNNDLSGHIALIERGTCTFTAKVTNAVNAGAMAILMFTDGRPKTVMGGDATSTTKSVPGVMIDRPIGLDIASALGSGDVNVTLSPTEFLPEPSPGNIMASGSSRGPNLGAINIIKPDVVAPGTNILAAITPTPLPDGSKVYTNKIFGYLSGTSMASPHVAGSMALIKQAYPHWPPSAAKSAMMTTARQNVLKEDGSTPADPFDMGSGYIQPPAALDPGLVYNAGLFEYAAFTCAEDAGVFTPGTCDFLESVGLDVEDSSQLNYPSVGISRVVGTHTVTRTLTAVEGGTGTYEVSIEPPPGFEVVIEPSTLEFTSVGESHSFDVTVNTLESAETGEWSFGAFTWSDGTHDVRSPVAVRAVGLVAPAEVFGEGADGSLDFDIQFGFSGPYTAAVHGLDDPTVIADSVADDPGNSYTFPGGPGITRYFIFYEPDTAFARLALFDDEVSGNSDLDMYLWECDAVALSCTQIDSSTTATSTESVEVVLPGSGTAIGSPGTLYLLDVHGWEAEGGLATYNLYAWDFGLMDDRGNMTVDPTDVTAALGATQTLTVEWMGLTPGTRYLGAISHTSSAGLEGLTLVNIQ